MWTKSPPGWFVRFGLPSAFYIYRSKYRSRVLPVGKHQPGPQGDIGPFGGR